MRRASDGQREGRTEGGEKPPVGGRACTLAGAGTGAWQDVPRVSVGPESERPILGLVPTHALSGAAAPVMQPGSPCRGCC